jgi:hypothetical protein
MQPAWSRAAASRVRPLSSPADIRASIAVNRLDAVYILALGAFCLCVVPLTFLLALLASACAVAIPRKPLTVRRRGRTPRWSADASVELAHARLLVSIIAARERVDRNCETASSSAGVVLSGLALIRWCARKTVTRNVRRLSSFWQIHFSRNNEFSQDIPQMSVPLFISEQWAQALADLIT